MARIYQSDSYGTSFQGQAQSRGFNPVQAVDRTKQIEQRTKEIVDDIGTEQQALERKQSIERTVLDAQQRVQRSNQKAQNSTINGLISLSDTFAKGVGQVMEIKAEQDDLQAQIDAAFPEMPPGGYSISDMAPTAIAEDQQFGLSQQAAATATIEVADGDSGMQSELQRPAVKAGIARNVSRTNAYQATANFDGYLDAFMSSRDITIKRPDGSEFTPATAESRADMEAAIGFALSNYRSKVGVKGMSRETIVRSLLPRINSSVNSFRRTRGALIDQEVAAAAEATAKGLAFAGLDSTDTFGNGGEVSPAQLLADTVNSFVGVGGRGMVQAGSDGIDAFVDAALLQGKDPGIIDQILNSEIPGTGTKYKDHAVYAMQLMTAKKKMLEGQRTDERNARTDRGYALDDLKAERAQALEAAGTDPDKIREVEKSFIERARGIGGFKSQQFIQSIQAGGLTDSVTAYNMLLEDPNLDKQAVDEAIDMGVITKPEQIAELRRRVDPDAKRVEAEVKKYKSDIKGLANDLLKQAQPDIVINAAGDPDGAAAVRLDLQIRINREFENFIRLNPDATPVQISDKLRDIKDKISDDIAKDEQAAKENNQTYRYVPKGNPALGAALTTKKAVSPETGNNRMARDLTGLTTTELARAVKSLSENNVGEKGTNNDINSTDDIILKYSDLKEAGDLWAAGGASNVPPRVKVLADALGQSPGEFLQNQLSAYGSPRDLKVERDAQLKQGLSPMSDADPIEAKALDVIGKYESDSVGGYNAVNQYGDREGHGTGSQLGMYSGDVRNMRQHQGRALTDFTVQEIMDLQANNSMSNQQWRDAGRFHAVGRYQFIGSTLAAIVQQTGLDTSAKFSPQLQDSLALYLLRSSSNGIGQWIGPSKPESKGGATMSERDAVRTARYLSSPLATAAQVRRASSMFQRTSSTELAAKRTGVRSFTGALTYRDNEETYTEAASALQGAGFQIGEHSQYGGTAPVHAGNSYHNYDEAFDITHQTGDRATSIALTRQLKDVIRSLGLFEEVIGPGDGDPNHETHLHLGGLMRPITAADRAAIAAVTS